jgi:hypothetical protein
MIEKTDIKDSRPPQEILLDDWGRHLMENILYAAGE